MSKGTFGCIAVWSDKEKGCVPFHLFTHGRTKCLSCSFLRIKWYNLGISSNPLSYAFGIIFPVRYRQEKDRWRKWLSHNRSFRSYKARNAWHYWKLCFMCPYDNRTFLSLSHRDYDSERYLVDSKSWTEDHSSLTFNTVLKTQSATTVVRNVQ